MENELTLCIPTKIYFTSYRDIGEIISSYGFKKVIIFIGGKSLEKSGRLNEIINILNKYKIEFMIIEGIEPNPDVKTVKHALDLSKDFNPELVLAIGGGSVIDAAKSYANSFYYDGDPIDFNKKIKTPGRVLHLGTIVTIAASGSEMSSSCVISDERDGFKGGFNSITNYPLFSILDYSFLYTLPKFQLACGAVDILSHSFERYFCKSNKYSIADMFALSVIKNVIRISKKMFCDDLKEEEKEDIFKEFLYTSTVSHNGITSFGKSYKMKCHYVEHLISGIHKDVAHGLGLSWLMTEFLKINKEELSEKIKYFGEFVFDNDQDTIVQFDNFIKSLPLEKTYKDYNISEDEFEEYLKLLKL